MKRKPQPPVTATIVAELLDIEGLPVEEAAYLRLPLGRPIEELTDAQLGRHARAIRRLERGE